jgi:hypothetical protein
MTLVASSPSISGICTSIRIRSNGSCRGSPHCFDRPFTATIRHNAEPLEHPDHHFLVDHIVINDQNIQRCRHGLRSRLLPFFECFIVSADEFKVIFAVSGLLHTLEVLLQFANARSGAVLQPVRVSRRRCCRCSLPFLFIIAFTHGALRLQQPGKDPLLLLKGVLVRVDSAAAVQRPPSFPPRVLFRSPMMRSFSGERCGVLLQLFERPADRILLPCQTSHLLHLLLRHPFLVSRSAPSAY